MRRAPPPHNNISSAGGSMGRRAFRRNDVIDQQSRSQTEPIPAATRNVHLDNATSGATFTRTVQPSPRQDNHFCLVRLKIARDAPRLLGLAIYFWTIPAQVVQIHIAISATGASEACRAAAARSASLRRGVPSKRFGTHAVTRAHCSPPPTGPVSAAAQAPPIDRLTIKSRSRRRQAFPACAHRLPQQPWRFPPSLEDDGWAGRRTTS